MRQRNGTYGITHFTPMWFLFIKQRVKFTISSISLLNGKRTNYSFSGLFCHTRQLSESPRSGTAGALCVAPSITLLCRLPAETRPRPRAPCTPHLQEREASCCFLKNLSRGDLYPECQWQGWRRTEIPPQGRLVARGTRGGAMLAAARAE